MTEIKQNLINAMLAYKRICSENECSICVLPEAVCNVMRDLENSMLEELNISIDMNGNIQDGLHIH
jgi:hypothetical protein